MNADQQTSERRGSEYQSVFVVVPAESALASSASEAQPKADTEPASPLRRVVEWILVLVVALGLALVIRAFLLGAFYIPSNSMEPLLTDGDRILVNKLSYVISEPRPGDVVVFTPPSTATDISGAELIKRVIAVGGQSIQFQAGILYLDGFATPETYLDEPIFTRDFARVDVPEDHVFVMGDNRFNSRDSRQFGPVPLSNVVGRAFLTYWPPGSLGGL